MTLLVVRPNWHSGRMTDDALRTTPTTNRFSVRAQARVAPMACQAPIHAFWRAIILEILMPGPKMLCQLLRVILESYMTTPTHACRA